MNTKPLTSRQQEVHDLLLREGPLNALTLEDRTDLKGRVIRVILWNLITRGLAVRHTGNPETYTARPMKSISAETIKSAMAAIAAAEPPKKRERKPRSKP